MAGHPVVLVSHRSHLTLTRVSQLQREKLVAMALLWWVSVYLSLSFLLPLSCLSRFPGSWESPAVTKVSSVLPPLTVNKAALRHQAKSQQPRPCLALPKATSSGCRSAVKVTVSMASAHAQAWGPVPGELLASPASCRLQCFRGSVCVMGTRPVCTVGSRGSSGCSDLASCARRLE